MAWSLKTELKKILCLLLSFGQRSDLTTAVCCFLRGCQNGFSKEINLCENIRLFEKYLMPSIVHHIW